ncbi:hypothetical protein [Nonomuraea sp. NPDC001831]|uniref:hypothetical protein n=1 Tax=Nonomuraea sp. NPDC001831 TaxID=3364340 RepID=UPI0036A441D6
MNGNIDGITVALLRKLKPEAQTEFLASPSSGDSRMPTVIGCMSPTLQCRKPNAGGPDSRAGHADPPSTLNPIADPVQMAIVRRSRWVRLMVAWGIE